MKIEKEMSMAVVRSVTLLTRKAVPRLSSLVSCVFRVVLRLRSYLMDWLLLLEDRQDPQNLKGQNAEHPY